MNYDLPQFTTNVVNPITYLYDSGIHSDLAHVINL
jgi:hypothetical protein